MKLKTLAIFAGALVAAAPAYALPAARLLALTSAYQHDVNADAYFMQLQTNGCASPGVAFRRAVSNYVIAEKAAGNWGNQDAEYIFATSDSCTAATNLAQPSLYKITWSGTLTFSVQKGLNGDAATGYGDTGVAQSALVKWTQNNGHLETWVAANGQNSIGLLAVSATRINAATNKVSQMNSATSITDTGGGTAGLHVADRTSSSVISTYLNGVVQSSGAATTSTTLNAADIVVCRQTSSFCSTVAGNLFAGFGAVMFDEAAHYRNVRQMLSALGAAGV